MGITEKIKKGKERRKRKRKKKRPVKDRPEKINLFFGFHFRRRKIEATFFAIIVKTNASQIREFKME